MKLLVQSSLVLACLIAAPAAAAPEDASINAFYETLTRERALDIRNGARAFHPEGLAIFLGNGGRPGPVTQGSEVAARLGGMAERMAADGMTMTNAYRIERRSVIGDTAVDTGYMRLTQTRNGASRNHYARFLVTLKRGADGQWRIISDASWPSDEAAWNATPRAEGLKYDG